MGMYGAFLLSQWSRAMIQENEIVMLIIGLGVFIFVLGNRPQLKRIPHADWFLPAFYLLLAGWILTVVENILWGEVLNYLEHICYAAASLLLAVWCWKVFRGKKEAI
jgi:hypothetical protein